MRGLLALLIGCVALSGGHLAAQQATSDRQANDPLLAEDPLLRLVAVKAPEKVPDIEAALRSLARDGSLGPLRNGEPPTQAELAQINQNPAFARAYASNPDRTIIVLRQTLSAIKD
jgi:hypothetical protein